MNKKELDIIRRYCEKMVLCANELFDAQVAVTYDSCDQISFTDNRSSHLIIQVYEGIEWIAEALHLPIHFEDHTPNFWAKTVTRDGVKFMQLCDFAEIENVEGKKEK